MSEATQWCGPHRKAAVFGFRRISILNRLYEFVVRDLSTGKIFEGTGDLVLRLNYEKTAKRTGRLFAALSVGLVFFAEPALVAVSAGDKM